MYKTRKKIAWVTAKYFLDVDIPIITNIAYTYQIHWYILTEETDCIDINIIDDIKKNGGNVIFYPIKKHWTSPFSLSEFITFFKKIKKFDLYYLNISSLSYTYLAILLTLKKDKTILATHNISTPKGARYALLAKLNMMFALNFFTNFHAFSMNQKELLLKNHPTKNVLYAPLALKDYGEYKKEQKDVNNPTTFLFFGHIVKYKRVDLLINASQMLYEETNIKFKVVIAGKCKNWDSYKKLIKYPNIFDLRIGYVQNDEIPAIFYYSDYMILPYQDLAQSGAIMVAYNYNKPVIVSDIPQFLEFVRNGIDGYIFKKDSASSLKDIMLKVLNDDKSTNITMAMNISEKVKKDYSAKNISNLYINYFNSFS